MAHIHRYLITALYVLIFFTVQLFTQAHAETIPATQSATQTARYHATYSTAANTSLNDDTGCKTSAQVNAILVAAWPKYSYNGSARADLITSTTNGTSTTFNYDTYNTSNNTLVAHQTGTTVYLSCPSEYDYSCPATGGWTLSGTSCTRSDCGSAQFRQPDGSCGACLAGRVLDSGLYAVGGSTTGTTACIGGCQTTAFFQAPQIICGATSGPSVIGQCTSAHQGQYIDNGNTCATPNQPPKLAPEPAPCPVCDCLHKGMSWGTVNGAVVCAPVGTPSTPPVTTADTPKTTTNPDNSKTETQTTTATDANGNVTTITTTTNTTVSGTMTSSSSTTTESQSSYCKNNPTDKLCKAVDKGFFSGDCANGFKCDGDASTCAIALEQYKRNCTYDTDLAQAKTDLSTKQAYTDGDKIIRGQNTTDVQNFLNGTGTTTINLPTSLSETGNYSFAASGFQDLTVTAMGRSVTLPISRVNPYFGYMGNILLALAYLAAFRIVLGNGRDD